MSIQFVNFNEKNLNPEFEKVFDVRPDEVFQKNEDLLLIDVREPDEYVGELGHASSAQLHPLGTLEAKLPGIPRDKTIVFICRSGRRSAKATQLAQSIGFEHVYNMQGGMLLWNQMELKTEK